MELTRFHRVRTALQTNAPRSANAELVDAQHRVRRGLRSDGWFEEVEVAATDDVDNLVIAMCRFPARLTAEDVAQRLTSLWEDVLSYPFWAAHTLLVWPDQVELEGATRIGEDGHYLTVHVLAQQGPHLTVVPRQRSRS